jgi:translation initiation factor IF-3
VPVPAVRKNRELPAREYRVIGEGGQNLGVLDRDAALKIAEDLGLDLIEISATAVPPVARVGNYDKFRYQKEKELKKEKKAQAQAKDDIKHVRIGLGSARNDLLIRARQIDEFLKEGYKVEILLKLRGREKANKEWALEKFNEFLELITENYRVIMSPKAGKIGFIAQVSKA